MIPAPMSMPRNSLAGLRVLITRPEGENADDWAAAFAAAGAIPLCYPTVTIVPPVSWDELDAAINRLDDYDWLIFTSQTAVAVTLGRLPGGRFPSAMRATIAAIGPKSAHAIENGGGQVTLVPADSRQEGLVEEFLHRSSGKRILLPQAAGARSLLAEKLRNQGGIVDVVSVYKTEPKTNLQPPPTFDIATFASPSALRGFLVGFGQPALAGKIVAVIGPTTAREASANGLHPVAAQSPDVDGLVLAVAQSRATQGDS
jgi:uroporphyrinogen-III synthase